MSLGKSYTFPCPEERAASAPPAILVSTPEEIEIVMAMDSENCTRRASEVYNVASNKDIVEDISYNFMRRYKSHFNVDITEDEGWTTVEEVALKIKRDMDNELLEEAKAAGEQKKNYKLLPSPKRSPKKTLADASIELQPKKIPRKSGKNYYRVSPKNSPPAPRKLLPEILESSVQQYRPVYQTDYRISNLVPRPYSPKYSGNKSVRPIRVPVASPRTLFTSGITTPEKTLGEEEVPEPKESKDTRGKIKKTQNVWEPREDTCADNRESPLNSFAKSNKDFVNFKQFTEPIDIVQKPQTLSNDEKRHPSTSSSPYSLYSSQEDMSFCVERTRKKHEISPPSSDESFVPDGFDVLHRRHSFDLDPEESLALSTLEAVMVEPKPLTLYNCSNQPFNSFKELMEMKGKAIDEILNSSAESNEDISKDKLSSPPVSSDDNLATLNDSLEDSVNNSLLTSMDSAEERKVSSAISDNTLSRDSLDGFLNDDIKSLRSCVTQENLYGDKTRETVQREESVDFTFESVDDDSPIHFAEHTEVEKKDSKFSFNFSKSTPKKSDQGKENEEKNRTSPFHLCNILSFGTKCKNKSKPKSSEGDVPKNESWTLGTIEGYLLKNSQEPVQLGLLNDEDVALYEAKKDGSISVHDNREIPVVKVSDELMPTTPGSSYQKRSAPNPLQRKYASWKPQDIENYLLEHNMNENLRLGLLSQEDIQIYEWKRATGMSPICDTSWTRETLRKNKIVRSSTSSSLSGSFPPSPDMSGSLTGESVDNVTDTTIKKATVAAHGERAIDVPASPLVLPPRRRAVKQ
nr:uncharacterized protein LOC128688773 [Cherax quadricarinatus]